MATPDAAGSPLSGSAHNVSPATGFDLSQCVPVPGELELELEAALRVDTAGLVAFEVRCRSFSALACGGAELGFVSFLSAMGSTAGGFVTLEQTPVTPVATQSVRCRFLIHGIGATTFDAYLDQARLSLPALIFSDGFESGDTAAWSTAVP